MKRMCAWCGSEMPAAETAEETGRWVTHGICERCFGQMLEEMGSPLHDFLDTLPVPVIVAGDDVVVEGVNQAAQEVLGKTPQQVAGRFGGEVFECANALLPGGCGRTVHCSGCAIRASVTHTFETGEACYRVPAVLQRQPNGDGQPAKVDLRITTERVGGRVLLRIDDA